MKPLDIAYEIFSEIPRSDTNDDALWYIIWNETGWPSFFDGDPETILRKQLKKFHDESLKESTPYKIDE